LGFHQNKTDKKLREKVSRKGRIGIEAHIVLKEPDVDPIIGFTKSSIWKQLTNNCLLARFNLTQKSWFSGPGYLLIVFSNQNFKPYSLN